MNREYIQYGIPCVDCMFLLDISAFAIIYVVWLLLIGNMIR